MTDPTPASAYTMAATVHGRYLLAAPLGPGPHPLLVGFHGYGENAERHLAALRAIPGSERWVLCAVQALHRFYDRKSEEVVGSWMTKQDRDLAIADNVAYVRDVIHQVREDLPTTETLVYAGFSQGVAMAYRVAAFAGLPANGLLALAGDLPEDVLASGMKDFPEVLVGTGSSDGWYTPARLEADQARLTAAGVTATTLVFEGGHEWVDAFRSRAGAFLARH